MINNTLSRRKALALGAAAVSATAIAGAGATPAAATSMPVARLERIHQRRIGLYAKNLATGRSIAHRPDERFAMCSTFKTFAIAAVLSGRLLIGGRDLLSTRAHYPPSLVAGDVWAPKTRQWYEDGYVPTVEEMCEATQRYSDNGAVNWLLQLLGGPPAVTSVIRKLGDRVTRLDRWEPDMSEWEPGQELDTTTPRAMAASYRKLLLTDAILDRRQRRRQLGWMLENTTSVDTFRKALPRGWKLADKTGAGSYATRNNVGIAWNRRDQPIVASCYTRADSDDVERIDAPLADVFELCVEELG